MPRPPTDSFTSPSTCTVLPSYLAGLSSSSPIGVTPAQPARRSRAPVSATRAAGRALRTVRGTTVGLRIEDAVGLHPGAAEQLASAASFGEPHGGGAPLAWLEGFPYQATSNASFRRLTV